MRTRRKRLGIVIAAALALSCDFAPMANAGPDQYVVTGTLVVLDGSASRDPEGHTLTYLWELVSVPAGSAAVLSNAAAVGPTFDADREGTYVVSMVVDDGTRSSTDTVTITARTPVIGPCAVIDEGRTAGWGVALLPDGRIVAVGSLGLGSEITRFESDASGGERIAAFRGSGRGIAVQPDGRLLVVGTRAGSNDDVMLLRFNADGAPDPSFGNGGSVTFDGGAAESGRALALQPDGKILVAASSYDGSDGDVLLLRFQLDGTLDASFGAAGVVVYDSGMHAFGAEDVALQPDGKIVVTGTVSATTDDVVVLRHDEHGSLDESFGASGVVTYDSGADDSGRAVALQPDGRIVVTGGGAIAGEGGVLLVRFDRDGTLDPTFGTGGVAVHDRGLGTDVALHRDGRIVVGGLGVLPGTTFNVALVASYNPDGTKDLGFASGGALAYDGGIGLDSVQGVLVSGDGGIVAVGGVRSLYTPYGGTSGELLLMKLFDTCR